MGHRRKGWRTAVVPKKGGRTSSLHFHLKKKIPARYQQAARLKKMKAFEGVKERRRAHYG